MENENALWRMLLISSILVFNYPKKSILVFVPIAQAILTLLDEMSSRGQELTRKESMMIYISFKGQKRYSSHNGRIRKRTK